MKNVTIYTTPNCGWCKITKDFFKHYNVEYTEKNVAEDMAARQEMVEKSSQLGVPVTDVDGAIVIGFNQPMLVKLLEVEEA